MTDNQHFKFTPSVWLVPFIMLFINWMVFVCDNLFNFHFTIYGIYPRTLLGLRGILLSPFLHGDLSHIANNTIPLFVLTTALIYFYREISLKVIIFGIILSGFLTWLIGRDSIHIGASGLIYVLVSFIFFKGLKTKYYRLMALSFAVVLVYGGMIWYVFPHVDEAISWEGHLSGFFTGLVFANYFKTPDYKKDLFYEWEKPNFNPQEDPFMKRFDENGNFVNPPKPEEIEVKDEQVLQNPGYKYIFIENNENEN